MNNDLRNNHSSMSSNKYIANKRYPREDRFYKESFIKDKNKEMLDIQSKGNRPIFINSYIDKRPSNQNKLLISKEVSKYPTNDAPGPNPYNADIIKGYYIDRREGYNPAYQIPLKENQEEFNENGKRNFYEQYVKNGGDEIEDEEGNAGEDEEEMEIENGNENEYNNISPQQDIEHFNNYNDYIGDGIVRNNIPNYSPYLNQNGQSIPYYYKKKNLKYTNYGQENENQIENTDGQYIIESPANQYIKINNNMPYNRKRVLVNLGDSVSSEAYAKKYNNQISPSYTDNSSTIYVKPKTNYNNMNNGISTEERGIESKQDITNNSATNRAYLRRPFNYNDTEENEIKKYNKIYNYDEDSLNVEPPIYKFPNNDVNKGGKVDLNNYAILKSRGKRSENEDEYEDDERKIIEEYDIDEEKLENIIRLQKYVKAYIQVVEIKTIKIQSFWRGRSTRRIMNLYQDLDEFIYLLSKVHFNHFSDNFYFFINQLFNVYQANTLDKNQLDSLDEEKEEDNQNSNNSNEEEEKSDENNPYIKKYNELLKDYNNLQKKYDNLSKNKFDKSTKKSYNNDINSVPGETTIDTIKTDNKKLKFRQLNNLTFSNDFNDEVEVNNKEYERRFFTPNHEDEDSFNDNSKDKKFSYSSIHSEENSKYFDNEHPKASTSSKRNIFKNKGKISKNGSNSLYKQKGKNLSYSPSLENDKQSRENSKKRNTNNENQIEKRINILPIITPKHEEEFGILKSNLNEKDIIKPEEMEEKIYDKYVSNFSKDLYIVKNNKINLKNEKEIKERLNYFDNEFLFPENENTMELCAKKKSDEKKLKDIFDNEKLLKKIKNKIFGNLPEKKLTNEASFVIENRNPVNIFEKNNNEIQQNINKLEIIQNNHRNFEHSKLDFESNELSLIDSKPKKNKIKNIPIFENEIKIERLPDKLQVFSEYKTLPTFNLNEEKNAFTINNIIPKIESKPTSYNIEKMIIDNVWNNEIKMNEPKVNIENDDINKKELVYLPFKDNKFKRLRRSKRTKENYFTIKSDLNKFDNELKEEKEKDTNKDKNDKKNELKKINENDFLIKSEYYYIEANDNKIPEIIEKQIKETIIINNPSNALKDFKDNEMILSSQNNFYIQGDKNKKIYLEDIEKNELVILSEDKNKNSKKDIVLRDKHRKSKNINKNEEFTINGDKKKYGNLNPIANDEFWFGNDLDNDIINENVNEENEDENQGFYENNNIYINDNMNIENIQQLEIIGKINDKNKDRLYVEVKQNIINIDGIEKKTEEKESQINIKQFNITTKKIVKKEKILSRSKFSNNKISLTDSFSLYGTLNQNIKYIIKDNDDENSIKQREVKDNIDNKKEIVLVKETILELYFKQIKKNTREIEIETEPINEFNDILPINNNNFIIKGKKLKTKEAETDIAEIFKNNSYDKNNKIKEKLENTQNECIMIKGKKKRMKESETEIDIEFNNIKPYYNNEITIYEPISQKNEKKDNNAIIKTENIDIIAPEKESNNDLKDNDKKEIILEESKIEEINLESRIRSFPKLDINNSLYETFNRKEKEKIEFEKINNESIMLESNKDKEKNGQFEEKEENVDKSKDYIIEYNQVSILKEKELDKNIISEKDEKIPKVFKELNINKSEEYNVKGKEKDMPKKIKKKRMKESETQIDNDLININEIPGSNIEINEEPKEEKHSTFRGRKDKNENNKIKYEKEKINEFNYQSDLIIEKDTNKNDKIFSNLDIKKSDEQIIYGKGKEKEILENIKKDSITINGKEKEPLENVKYDNLMINGKEKEEYENIKKDSILIKGKEKEPLENVKNYNLTIDRKEKEALQNIKKDSILFSGKERQALENIKNYNLTIDRKEKEALQNIKKDSILISGKERQALENIKNDNLLINGKEKEALQNIKNETILINGKEKEPLKNIKNENLTIYGKEKEPYQNINNNSIIINGKEKEEYQNISNEAIILKGKEKEKQIFEYSKNDSLNIVHIKNKTIEEETQIDNDLNYNLVSYNNDKITYEAIKPIKKENIIVKNDSININEIKNKKELYLIIDKQEPLNINSSISKKEFNKEDVSICYSENFAIKIKEENEIEEEKERKIEEEKKEKIRHNKNVIQQYITNKINNLEVSIEKRLEIIGNQSKSNIKDNNNPENNNKKLNEEENLIENNKDLDSNLENQINNIVQDKLEKEKQKNMDQTKNKLIKVFKVIKLKNALGKNIKNKKDFFDRLKQIKTNKNEKNLSSVNAINYNYINNIEKKEYGTNTDNLDKLYHKNNYSFLDKQKGAEIEIITYEDEKKMNVYNSINIIEKIKNDEFSLLAPEKEKTVKSRKIKKHKKVISLPLNSVEDRDIKENDLDDDGINKEDKGHENDALKELDGTTKKIEKEILTKKEFLELKSNNINSFSLISQDNNKDNLLYMISVGTQTPKLRPPKKAAQKVVFHEIKTIIKKEQKPINKYDISHVSNFKLISKVKTNKIIKEKINEDKDEDEEENEESEKIKIYRIEVFKNLFNLYFNKRLETLKLIYWIKWNYIINNADFDEKNKKFKKLIMKYPRIFAMRLLDCLDQYIDLKGAIIIIKNIFNKKTLMMLKRNKRKKKQIYYSQEKVMNKKKLAYEKIESILRKYAGKYVFSLYKKKK